MVSSPTARCGTRRRSNGSASRSTRKAPARSTNLVQHHAIDINVPIGCAEVAIYPGDIMVGDEEGVVCVPRHLADEVAEEPAPNQRSSTHPVRDRQRQAAEGHLPADEDTLRRYHESQFSR